MIERAELRVHRNSTLKAGVIDRTFFGKRRQELGDVAAKLGVAAAARLGQEHQQLAQRDDPHRVNDLAALPGGGDQAGPIEGAQMKRRRRCRGAEAVG